MCGRKTLTKGKIEIIEQLSIAEWDDNPPYHPSYNIAPTNFNPVLILDGIRRIKMMRWGLIPDWAEDDSSLPIMINARIETVMSKPSFAQLVDHNRCLAIADGYYEWCKIGGHKQPYYIHHPDRRLLLLAGLWNRYQPPNTSIPIFTYTILTKAALPEIKFIHPRMPAMIAPDHVEDWLNPNYRFSEVRDIIDLSQLSLNAYPVSSLVNSVRNNSPECIRPFIEPPEQTLMDF
jgi:putative SOS response-associated peptidase YedK